MNHQQQQIGEERGITERRCPSSVDPLEGAELHPETESAVRGFSVLVVDDIADCRDSLAALLEAYGCEVAVASSGREGLAVAQRIRPDAIFTDIGMPEMDGYAFAAAVKSDRRLAGTFIVAVSGWTRGQMPEDVGRSPFNYRLVKPAEVAEILAALALAQRDWLV